MTRNRQLTPFGLIAALALAADVGAIPTIAIDLDPVSAGIQASAIVSPGTHLDIDVVIVGDGMASFNAAAADLLLGNNNVSVSGGPAAGTLVDSSLFAVDAFAPGPPLQAGNALTPGPLPPPTGFGGAGLLSLILPFDLLPDGAVVSLYSLTLLAGSPGSSLLTLGSADPFGDILAVMDPVNGAVGVPVELADALIQVREETPMSEPGTIWLLAVPVLVATRRSWSGCSTR